MSRPISVRSIGHIIRDQIRIQSERNRYYDWNFRKRYYESVTSSSINRVQHHFNSQEPLFMMGVRRDVLIQELEAEEVKESGEVSDETQDMLIELARDEMEKEIRELKELLLAYGLGFIPLRGRYMANDAITQLGIEMSVLVPMSPNYTGHDRYTGTEGETIRDADFVEFSLELAKMYDQESILLRDSHGNLGLFWLANRTFDKFKDKVYRLNGDELNTYMSLVNNKGKSDGSWWNLALDEDLVDVTSHLYTNADLEVMCGIPL